MSEPTLGVASSRNDVTRWLQWKDLSACVLKFEEQKIDGEAFQDLTIEELEGYLGVQTLGDRKKILAKIAQMKAPLVPHGFENSMKLVEEQLLTFLNDPELGLPAAEALLMQFLNKKSLADEDKTFAKETLDELVFEMQAGDLRSTSNYMEADPENNKIFVNTEWLQRFSSKISKTEKTCHEHLLLQKSLHEIGHLLTRPFLQHVFSKKGKKSKEGKMHKALVTTPTRIGKMKKGKKVIGDAGYGLEESISGGRLFHESKDTAFDIVCLVLEKREKGKGGRMKRCMYEVKDTFLSNKKKKITLRQFKPTSTQLTAFTATNSQHNKGASLFVPFFDERGKAGAQLFGAGNQLDISPRKA